MVWTYTKNEKAHLCAGGHCQIYGNMYWTTFAPIISWTTVQCVFILALLLGWYMCSINFIMPYTQAKVKTNIFMKLPMGTTLPNADLNKHLLKLQQDLYGLKDSKVTWHKHIKTGLKEHGFVQSQINPCLFINGKVLLVLYIDGTAFFSPSSKAIDDKIASLKKVFNLTDEGELKDYLGTCFSCHLDG